MSTTTEQLTSDTSLGEIVHQTLDQPTRRQVPPAGSDDSRDPIHRLQELSDGSPLRLLAASDGAVSALGRLGDTACVMFATDPRRKGGAMGADGCAEIVAAYNLAMRLDIPVVGVWQSGGARLAEGAFGLDAVGTVFAAMTKASGVVPQISIVLGPAAGGAAYGPALTDVVIVGPDARVFVTGPDIVTSVTGEAVDAEALGGPDVHAKSSGLSHIRAATHEEAFARAREVASLLANVKKSAAPTTPMRDIAELVPTNPRRAYDVRPIVDALLDVAPTELHREWAPNVVTSLGRLDGQPVGVIANNPIRMGGCLTAVASEKAARFVRLCDSFGIPLVVVVDVPGYLPGRKQEADGIVRRGAKLLHAFAAARVPRFTVITRKAYGGAYIAMNSKSLGASRVLAWPTAVVDVMGSEAAVAITRRRDIAELPEHSREAGIARFAAEHSQLAGGLDRAVQLGIVDDVIEPAQTRATLASLLATCTPTRSREKNIPL